MPRQSNRVDGGRAETGSAFDCMTKACACGGHGRGAFFTQGGRHGEGRLAVAALTKNLGVGGIHGAALIFDVKH